MKGSFIQTREDRDDRFAQSSKRKTCKHLEKTNGTKKATRGNTFVLNPTQSGLEVGWWAQLT